MEKILIIGASGFLGRELIPILSTDFHVIGTSYSQVSDQTISLDITNPKQVEAIIEKIDPSIIVITAALTDMDHCETDRDLAMKINVTGVESIMRWCSPRVVVYYSSDAIFDGVKGNYHEEDQPSPLNFYGETKLKAENLVKKNPRHLILRTSMLYTDQSESPKFINYLIRNLSQGKAVNVAMDYTTCPTFISDVAKATLTLLQKKCRGVYHVAGASALSCHKMALDIISKWGFDPLLVHPVKRAELLLKAPRAENTTLNISKLKGEGINMSTFEQGIERVWEASPG